MQHPPVFPSERDRQIYAGLVGNGVRPELARFVVENYELRDDFGEQMRWGGLLEVPPDQPTAAPVLRPPNNAPQDYTEKLALALRGLNDTPVGQYPARYLPRPKPGEPRTKLWHGMKPFLREAMKTGMSQEDYLKLQLMLLGMAGMTSGLEGSAGDVYLKPKEQLDVIEKLAKVPVLPQAAEEGIPPSSYALLHEMTHRARAGELGLQPLEGLDAKTLPFEADYPESLDYSKGDPSHFYSVVAPGAPHEAVPEMAARHMASGTPPWKSERYGEVFPTPQSQLDYMGYAFPHLKRLNPAFFDTQPETSYPEYELGLLDLLSR